MRLPRTAAVLVAAASLSVACSSTPTVSQSDLEEAVAELLTEEVGTAPDDVSCPEEGLEGEEGATQRCTLTAGEDEIGVDVVVTSVDGEDVNFSVEVDDAPAE